jgi:hypothetical protein
MSFALCHGSALLDLCISQIEEQLPNTSPDVRSTLTRIASDYLRKLLTYPQASSAFASITGITDPIDRLREILEIPDDPLPSVEDEDQANAASRRRMKMWSTYEDNRLLAGIYRFGVNNWAPISRFVGNSRTRAQCAQRWARGLNPRICKSGWGAAEDLRLVQLVSTYGDKAWTKVAGSMGNRSDVQCRYHYYQLTKDMPQLAQMAGESQFPSFRPESPLPPMPVRPLFQGIPMPRFSMPVVQHPDEGEAQGHKRRGSHLGFRPTDAGRADAGQQAPGLPAPEPVRRISLPSIHTITSLLNGHH